MPTASPSSRDPTIETLVFWERFKNEIIGALIVVLLAVIGFTGYRFYSDRQAAAPSALFSQVFILKAKNRTDEARRICEAILTQHRTSFWAGEAMQELRLLKPSGPSEAAPASTAPPFLAAPARKHAATIIPKSAPTPAATAKP